MNRSSVFRLLFLNVHMFYVVLKHFGCVQRGKHTNSPAIWYLSGSTGIFAKEKHSFNRLELATSLHVGMEHRVSHSVLR